ncbi:MAG: hypothetical protein R2795_14245 [Saprospiraceae bacterium]
MTKETVRASYQQQSYLNDKSVQILGLDYYPLSATIALMAAAYLTAGSAE